MYLCTEGTRKHQRHSDPQLPRPLWEGLERDFPNSFIFTSEFSHIRQCIVTKKVSPNSAVPVCNLSIYCVENEETCEKEETEKLGVADLFKNMGYLHLAAFQGDLPLAFEARRLGTSVRTRNKDGFTALYFGCRTIGMWTRPRGPSNKSAAEQADDDEAMAALAAKVARVCIFLLCQYADPNETHDGVSLLHLACQSGSWDLIRALLLHGADPTPSTLGPSKHPVRFLRMEADRARFRSLASEVKNSTTGRPPCLCPCASGLPLEGCHGVPGGKPYPPEYICCCGTKRIYSACCRKRTGKAWMEEWNETGDRLVQRKVEFVESLLSPSSSEPISESEAKKRFEDAERTERQRHIQDNIIRVLGASGRLDPAYIVAIKKTGILVPSPADVFVTSKGHWKETLRIWNGAVDTYIASGVDSRPKEIIENAAKMGMIGGPLYRRCEASGCANIEGRDSVQLKRCMRCQTAVYCGRACQKSAWLSHRSTCQSGKVKAQLLPSQRTLLTEMARATCTEDSAYMDALY